MGNCLKSPTSDDISLLHESQSDRASFGDASDPDQEPPPPYQVGKTNQMNKLSFLFAVICNGKAWIATQSSVILATSSVWFSCRQCVILNPLCSTWTWPTIQMDGLLFYWSHSPLWRIYPPPFLRQSSAFDGDDICLEFCQCDAIMMLVSEGFSPQLRAVF